MPQSHVHLCRRAFHQPHRSNISTPSRPPTVTLYSSLRVFTYYVIAWVFLFSLLISTRIPILLLFTRKTSRTNTPATGTMHCASLSSHSSAAAFTRKRQGRGYLGRTIEQDAWATCDLYSVVHLRPRFGSWRYWRWAAIREHPNVCASQAQALLFSSSLVATIPMTFSLESEAVRLDEERF
jgi:hypothetical protein